MKKFILIGALTTVVCAAAVVTVIALRDTEEDIDDFDDITDDAAR